MGRNRKVYKGLNQLINVFKMEPISQTIITSFVTGIIIGIIDEINRKVMAVIWVLAVIFVAVSFFIQGPAAYSIGLNWGIGNWIAMFITVNLSFMLGKFGLKNLKEAFKNG